MAEFTEIHPGLAIAQGAYKDEAAQIADLISATPSDKWKPNQNGVLIYGDYTTEPDQNPHIAACELGVQLVDPSSLFVAFFRNLPEDEGPWHYDQRKFLPLYILYLSEIDEEHRTFQYQTTKPAKDRWDMLLDPKEDEIASVHVSAGDLLRITSSSIRHRGINPTSVNRDIVSMYHL